MKTSNFLQTANHLKNTYKDYDSAIGRYYYYIFRRMKSYLIECGYEFKNTGYDHNLVKEKFSHNIEKILKPTMDKNLQTDIRSVTINLQTIRKKRNKADYDDIRIKKDEVDEIETLTNNIDTVLKKIQANIEKKV